MIPLRSIGLPTSLTLLRIALAVPLIGLCYWEFEQGRELRLWTFALFVFASVTDYADGYLARRFNSTTVWGGALDSVADKILVLCAFISLLLVDSMEWFGGSMAAILLGRDFLMSGLRSANLTSVTEVSYLAKVKTTLLLLSLALLLLNYPPLLFVGQWGVIASVLLSLWTAIRYLRAIRIAK